MSNNDFPYRQIIIKFLERNGASSIQEIYNEVENKRKNISKHWRTIVRNQLYYCRKIKRENNKWLLK